MGKDREKFEPSNTIDKDAPNIINRMASYIQPCTRKDIAVVLETIASTFSINIPNETGLEQYFRILQKYPASLLKDCMEDILIKYKYPRLPLPVEFTDRLDAPYEHHLGWLKQLTKSFYKLELWKQSEYNKQTKGE